MTLTAVETERTWYLTKMQVNRLLLFAAGLLV